jgi:tetratricopeptide (TPR) repeat protein
LKIAMTFRTLALLLWASVTLALPLSAAQSATQSAGQQAPAKKGPQAKSKAEFDAYQSAAAQTDPAKLEAAATDFAQKYPASQLRPFLFQRAMGLYQQANHPGEALEMARAVLKYDPGNAVALVAAAQVLAERTHDNDLDRSARLEEAGSDVRSALQHAGEMARPANLTAEQFADAIAQLRGAAHEVIATIAFKKLDYVNAIKEYNAAAVEEKGHTDPVVWLRLAVAHDKSGEYELGIAYAEKAIAASEAGSQVRELAEKEKARLEALTLNKPAQKQSESSHAPGSGEGTRAY